jgi:hypothetical protein
MNKGVITKNSNRGKDTMERKLYNAIVAVVDKAVERAVKFWLTKICERWITGDALCHRFQMFTKDWLEKYGDCLPRKRIKVTLMSGETRGTRWAYPQHQIAMNIADGLYDDMKLLR